MNDTTTEATTPAGGLGIAAVERDTGLGKDTLRVWERRYGFPQPLRDACGERVYPAEQVDQLRLIKRLIDQGRRPGALLRQSSTTCAANWPSVWRATDWSASSSKPCPPSTGASATAG